MKNWIQASVIGLGLALALGGCATVHGMATDMTNAANSVTHAFGG